MPLFSYFHVYLTIPLLFYAIRSLPWGRLLKGTAAHLLPGPSAGAVRRRQASGAGGPSEKQEAGGTQVSHLYPGESLVGVVVDVVLVAAAAAVVFVFSFLKYHDMAFRVMLANLGPFGGPTWPFIARLPAGWFVSFPVRNHRAQAAMYVLSPPFLASRVSVSPDVEDARRFGGVPDPARPHVRTAGREHGRREATATDGQVTFPSEYLCFGALKRAQHLLTESCARVHSLL